MRIEIDKNILVSLKTRIIRKIPQLYNFDFNEKLIANMNNVEALYVENLKEQLNFRMISRMKDIGIDESFVNLDSNGNFIGFKQHMLKLIYSQLGHELLHNASRSDGHSGINSPSMNCRGLNEGITQMITEDIFGYVVSPFSDGYRDLKKVAKIISLCVGTTPILNSFFNHTYDLWITLNKSAESIMFYQDLNKDMNDLYEIGHSTKKYDCLYKKNARELYRMKLNHIYKKIITYLVIPKLNTLKIKEKEKFIAKLLEVTSDDKEAQDDISIILANMMNKTNIQLEQEKVKIKDRENSLDERFEFVRLIYSNPEKALSLLRVDNKGNITLMSTPQRRIIDPLLCSKIYTAMFEHDFPNMNPNIFRNVIEGIKDGKKLTFKDRNILNKRKSFEAFKNYAFENGVIILNSYLECDTTQSIQPSIIRIEENQTTSFSDLRTISERFELQSEKFGNGYVSCEVVDRITREKVNDYYIKNCALFSLLWRYSAATKHHGNDESDANEAFSYQNERLYSDIVSIMKTSILRTGNLDINAILKYAESSKYKHASHIVGLLFRSPVSYEWIYKFIAQNMRNISLQVVREKSLLETYSNDYEQGMISFQVENIMNEATFQNKI
jgi:hypothetical protein